MKNKIWISFVLSFFLSLSFMTPVQLHADYSRWLPVGQVITAAGAALLGVGGVITFADWLLNETDLQLIERANSKYNNTYRRYHDMVYWFEQTYQLSHITSQERARVMNDVSEAVLYEIGTKMWSMNEKEYNYRSQLRSSLNQLTSYYRKVCRRIRELEGRSYDFEVRRVLEQLRGTMRTIESFLPHLGLFSDYLEHHRSYFALYECDGTVRNRYKRELNIIEQYRHDTYRLADELRRFVLNKQYGVYPNVRYVNKLEQYIRKLNLSIRRVSYNYADRVGWARQLADSLCYIRGIITSGSAYKQELYNQGRGCVECEYGVIKGCDF